MRNQEIKRLKELCVEYDLDWQEYDFEAYGYQTVKRMILKDVGIKTAEMEKDELEQYESLIEWFDSRSIEEKIVLAGRQTIQGKLPYFLLVILVYRHHVSLALELINSQFKGNLHRFGVARRQDKRGRPVGSAVVWLKGQEKTVQLILKELDKHDLYFRVLRNSPFRTDFLHYHKGKFYSLPRSVLKKVTRKVSKLP